MGKRIFVGNLSFNTTSGELEALFREFGTCESVTIVTDRDSGRSRGFGFVEMSTAEEASEAVKKFNGRELDGRTVRVELANSKGAGGGRSGGGGGYRSSGGGFRSGGSRW